jgi:uncharacterized protein
VTKPSDRPLTDRDIAALDELLTGIAENRDPLDVAMLDGFLVGVLLQPDVVLPSDWLPLVFDSEGREALPDQKTAQRAFELVMRRYNELAACIAAREPFDPIVFEMQDDAGAALEGKAAIVALMPWAAGFQNAFVAFPGLMETSAGNDELTALMAVLLRHIPPELADDDDEREARAPVNAEMEKIAPLADLDEAIDELVATVLDIADLTRPNRPLTRDAPKVGRNDPCPCGSGRKYKACHGREH